MTRKFVDDNSSEPSQAISSALGSIHISQPSHDAPSITAIVCCYEGTKAICGKANGVIEMYDLTNDNKSWKLYQTGSMEISVLDWSDLHRLVASADISGRFQVVQMSSNTSQPWYQWYLLTCQILEGGLGRRRETSTAHGSSSSVPMPNFPQPGASYTS